jgi:hypothetical protein
MPMGTVRPKAIMNVPIMMKCHAFIGFERCTASLKFSAEVLAGRPHASPFPCVYTSSPSLSLGVC